MPRERRLHGDLGRFQIADLAHQNLVRVLPKNGSQDVTKRIADVRSIGTWMIPSMSYSTGPAGSACLQCC
jgi:hypothetical protein